MANIGSLVADMRLESAAFRRDLGKATTAMKSQTAQMRRSMRQVETAARRVNKAVGQLRTGFAALAGALAVRQFTTWTKAAISASDAIAKQSRQLQVSTAALQRYRIEGELAGVTTEKMDTALGAFVKRVGELRAGTGTLVTILDKSNKALKEQLLAAENSTEGMEIMLRAIRNAGSAFDKQALSAAAFGRQAGQAMVLLADSAGALDAEMAQLITRSDEMLRASERLNDQFTLLKAAFSAGFDTAIVEGLSGSVDATAESMREARKIGEDFGRFVGQAMRFVAEAGRLVARNMREIVSLFAGLAALKVATMVLGIARAMTALAVAMRAAAASGALLGAVTAGLKKGIVGLAAAGAAIAAFVAQAESIDPAIKDAVEGLRKYGEGSSAVAAGSSSAGEKVNKLTSGMRHQALQAKQLISALKRSRKEYENLRDEIELENEATRQNIDLSTKQGQAWLEAARANQKLQRQLKESLKEQEEAARKQRELAKEQREMFLEPFKNAIRGIQDSFTDMFEGIFSGGVNSFSDLADSVKRIFVRLAAEIATLLVFRPVVGGVLGSVGLGSIANQMGLGGGITGSLGGGLGDVFSAGSSLALGGSNFLGQIGTDIAQGLGLSVGGEQLLAGAGFNLPFGAIGSLGANLLGLGSGNMIVDTLAGGLGGLAGGAIGTSIGTILGMAGGPVGAALGGFLGTAAGSLFGGGGFRNGPLTEGFTGVRDGRLVVTGVGAKNADIAAGRQFAEGGAGLVNSLVEAGIISLTGTGIRFDTKFGKLRTFTGPTPNNDATPAGGFLGIGTNPEQVLIDTIKGMVERGFAEVDSPEVREAIKNSAASTLQQFARELDIAKGAGLLAARIPFAQAAGNIVDFVRGQRLDRSSSLSPTQRLTEAQRQFGDLLSRVRSGELGLTQNLTQAAGQLINIGRENFASTVSFANLEQSTLSSLLSVADRFTDEKFVESQVEATRQQTGVIEDGNEAIVAAIDEMKREIQLLNQKIAA